MMADKDISGFSDIARVGTDESGKGDYFGPLVVAAVWADLPTGAQLEAWGVIDSKRISDGRAAQLAQRITSAKIPHAVVAIGPAKYNELYAKMKNLNRLLAWAHARAIENVLENASAEVVVADQFGDERLIEQALMQKGRDVRLFQTPRGERDIAVAAASVLARAEFLGRLKRLSDECGMVLPKGAGSPVDAAAARLVAGQGEAVLSQYAKLHFKNTQKARLLLTRQGQ